MRVLIADDNRDNVESLVMLCEAWDLEPVVAYDGEEALKLLCQPNAPMLCLLDWEMPGRTGIDICEQIRQEKDRPYRYIILITGRANEMVVGLNAGADDFLFKPVNADELRARLLTGKRVLNLQEQLLCAMQQLKQQATHDSLTGLWNRAAILDRLQHELSRGDRQHQPLSIALADIDHFKSINDTHGHLVGDAVLKHVAQTLMSCLRSYDFVGRFGGEEFLLVLPGCDQKESLNLAERLRQSLQEEQIADQDRTINVTASIGVATWNRRSDMSEIIRIADEALYQAKHQGRNQVVMANSAPSR